MSDTPLCNPSEDLQSLLQSLRHTSPRLITSPPTQPRRASVALIIRLKPSSNLVFEGHEPEGWQGEVIPKSEWGLGLSLQDFFRLPWVRHPQTTPELLFIRRASAQSSSGGPTRWSSHIAFPGGRHEPSDESALYTAYRETWEEIGVDLAERDFLQVGRLDEREITTSLGKRLLMILSPFVFLQTTPFTPPPELQAAEVSSVHWIPLTALTPPFSPSNWSHIEIDISTRLSPRNKLIRWALRGLVGKMQFGCVLLPDEPEVVAEGFDVENAFALPAEGSGSWLNKADGKRMLRLWGLSLGMTLDLLGHLPTASPSPILIPASTPTSRQTSPARQRAVSLGPKTPVTVPSSFEAQWGPPPKQLTSIDEKEISSTTTSSHENTPQSPVDTFSVPSEEGGSGAGLSRSGSLGSRVDVKGMRGRRRRGVGPGVTAVFPRFSYPDVNFWIWVFGRRYRQVVKGWEASMRRPSRVADRRVNWSGAALSTFYSAVRQALVVAILLRGLATVGGIAGLAYWLFKFWGSGHGDALTAAREL